MEPGSRGGVKVGRGRKSGEVVPCGTNSKWEVERGERNFKKFPIFFIPRAMLLSAMRAPLLLEDRIGNGVFKGSPSFASFGVSWTGLWI